jgi:hypothetical protein
MKYTILKPPGTFDKATSSHAHELILTSAIADDGDSFPLKAERRPRQ